MNVHELLTSIKTKLQDAEWSVGSTVFAPASVIISAYVAIEELTLGREPWAIITPGAMTSDDEQPDIIEQDIQIQLVTCSESAGLGEAVLMGSNQVGSASSIGKGLLELEEVMMEQIKLLAADDGITVVFMAANAAQARMIPDSSAYYVARSYSFKGYISTVADA